MAQNEQRDPAAGQYARALLDLAASGHLAEQLDDELASLSEILRSTPAFAMFLSDPSVRPDEKRRVIDAALGATLNPLLLNTLRVMNRHNRLGLLRNIATEYHRMLDERLGNVEVDVTSASPLDEELTEQVRARVSAVLKKNAILRSKVDESIIGGLILKVGDRLIDSSVKTQIELVKRKLLAAAR